MYLWYRVRVKIFLMIRFRIASVKQIPCLVCFDNEMFNIFILPKIYEGDKYLAILMIFLIVRKLSIV